MPESITADVSQLELLVGQAQEIHLSYVPCTANAEMDYTAQLDGLAGTVSTSGTTVTVTATEEGNGTLTFTLDRNNCALHIPVTAEKEPEYLCYFDFTAGSNDNPQVTDSVGNAVCTLEGFAGTRPPDLSREGSRPSTPAHPKSW
ncbi:hypothetical protein [Anaeromassilibacillus sp. SJQ-1]|uniref:hypothetical protein n=1 Tax=Anaeromassilibacillus sp. SJQ-1 TaxID=3375419 RepID=UPI0039898261